MQADLWGQQAGRLHEAAFPPGRARAPGAACGRLSKRTRHTSGDRTQAPAGAMLRDPRQPCDGGAMMSALLESGHLRTREGNPSTKAPPLLLRKTREAHKSHGTGHHRPSYPEDPRLRQAHRRPGHSATAGGVGAWAQVWGKASRRHSCCHAPLTDGSLREAQTDKFNNQKLVSVEEQSLALRSWGKGGLCLQCPPSPRRKPATKPLSS